MFDIHCQLYKDEQSANILYAYKVKEKYCL